MNISVAQVAELMGTTGQSFEASEVGIEVPTHSVENGVFESSGSPSVPSQNPVRVDISRRVDESDTPTSEGKTDDAEREYVDGDFGIVAVNNWDELFAGVSMGAEQTDESEPSSAASVPRPVSACGMRSDTTEVTNEVGGGDVQEMHWLLQAIRSGKAL